MASWEPVDVDPIDRDGIADEDDLMNDLQRRFNKLRQFNEALDESRDKNLIDITTSTKNALKHDTIELVANQIYDRLTISFKNARKRFDIQKAIPILEPIRNYDNFKLADDGEISYVHSRTEIDLGNINGRLKAPWEIHRLGVAKLKSISFANITDKDINPYRDRYIKARERKKLRKLDHTLTLNRLGFLESSTARGVDSSPCIISLFEDQ